MDRLLIVYLVIINIIAFAIEDAKNSIINKHAILNLCDTF